MATLPEGTVMVTVLLVLEKVSLSAKTILAACPAPEPPSKTTVESSDMFTVDGAFTVGASLVSETVMVKLLVTVLPVPRLVAWLPVFSAPFPLSPSAATRSSATTVTVMTLSTLVLSGVYFRLFRAAFTWAAEPEIVTSAVPSFVTAAP